MDRISDEVLTALHTIAAVLIGEKVENGNTTMCVDYNIAEIRFNDLNHNSEFSVNCSGDSERGAVIDVVRQLYNKFA